MHNVAVPVDDHSAQAARRTRDNGKKFVGALVNVRQENAAGLERSDELRLAVLGQCREECLLAFSYAELERRLVVGDGTLQAVMSERGSFGAVLHETYLTILTTLSHQTPQAAAGTMPSEMYTSAAKLNSNADASPLSENSARCAPCGARARFSCSSAAGAGGALPCLACVFQLGRLATTGDVAARAATSRCPTRPADVPRCLPNRAETCHLEGVECGSCSIACASVGARPRLYILPGRQPGSYQACATDERRVATQCSVIVNHCKICCISTTGHRAPGAGCTNSGGSAGTASACAGLQSWMLCARPRRPVAWTPGWAAAVAGAPHIVHIPSSPWSRLHVSGLTAQSGLRNIPR